ncbi:MAG: pyruvate carboxylase subunit B [Coriobacteriaceae bacterium]|nr:pyruvate carboxylase subunit B [Coriobacteriaceae bacterium]
MTFGLPSDEGFQVANRHIGFTETVLRDAQQSLIATRLPFSEMEPILSKLDAAGYHSLECWGGATFDVCMRFLDEDPWERLRKLRAGLPNTKLQMLLRGQNILGYKHYPDDIVRRFVKAAVKNGIDIIRIFDALNDVNNLKVAIETAVEAGAEASGAISYTTSPVHTREMYVNLAKEMVNMGCQSICIKDMAGILTPNNAYGLVAALKDALPDNVPVIMHTHSTAGMAFMTYMKGIEAGADVIDTAISPFSGGTSQPTTESLHVALTQMGYDTGLDEPTLYEIADYFKGVRAKFIEDGTLNPISMGTDTQCLNYQIPGGMLSNLLSQLKSLNASDKFDEALLETPRVREDLGFPPLVTPTSQLVGTQAVQNVLAGERYKNVGAEVKAYCRGEYGRTPAPINPEIQKLILGDEKPIEGRYADTLPTDTFEKAQAELGETARSEEDVLSYIAFPPVAEKFFETRKANEEKVAKYSIEKIED